MFHETARRMGTQLNVNIGRPIAFEELPAGQGRSAVLNYMRDRTIALAPARDREKLRGEFTKGTW
jgi:tripartite-type tricarboxylate transporter receptor subunit TctC